MVVPVRLAVLGRPQLFDQLYFDNIHIEARGGTVFLAVKHLISRGCGSYWRNESCHLPPVQDVEDGGGLAVARWSLSTRHSESGCVVNSATLRVCLMQRIGYGRYSNLWVIPAFRLLGSLAPLYLCQRSACSVHNRPTNRS